MTGNGGRLEAIWLLPFAAVCGYLSGVAAGRLVDRFVYPFRMLIKQLEGRFAQVNQARPAHVRRQCHHEIVDLAALEPHGCPPSTDASGNTIEVHVHVLHASDLIVSEAEDSRLYGCRACIITT